MMGGYGGHGGGMMGLFQPPSKENDEGKKSYDVFFCLSGETTQDEAGTAAYKTVELDYYLGEEPVQYHEV